MNTFANSLFSVLFGWARGLIQRVWNDAASGQLCKATDDTPHYRLTIAYFDKDE